MKKVFIISLLALISITINAQITVDPAFPTADQAVVVTLNTAGTGLEGYTGDVYAHTGLTIGGNDWQYVIGDWGINSTQPKLTKIGNDLFELHITPSIRDFYNAGASDVITEMCFVFRSADGSQQTFPDIYYEVYEEAGLNLLITKPELSPIIVALNDMIEVEGVTSEADSTLLYIDGVYSGYSVDPTFSFELSASEYGKHWVKLLAKNETAMVADSFYYYVRSEVVVEALPAGIRDGITYTSETSVVLCLYAPEKEFVFAWGDHSNWELTDDIYMKQTPDANRYWLEITGLEPKKQYIFQYFIDGDPTQLVGDMYCEQVSDPWDDKYISSETYPDLPPYPEGKTFFLASVFQTDQDKYQWQVEDFTPPKKEDLVIYELLVRDFIEKHDFNTLIDTLDYLERLGVNVIELMPVNEFQGNSSWGYNPSYYFAPDKYYGPRNTLKAFIDECHSRGIAVFMDFVLNHSYGGSPFVQMYYNIEENRPAANSPWYNEVSNFPYADANWGYDFNHESLATQALVDSVNSYWMSEYKIDGFRFDFTKGFSNTIHGQDDPWGSKYDADRVRLLKRMSDEIWKRNENAYIIFEHLADNSEEKELANYGIMMWGNLTHAYNEGTMGYNTGGKSDFSWISYKKRGWNDPNVVGYMESHDEERLMFKNITYGNSSGDYNTKDLNTALKRMELAAAFFFTIPGPKMIWQFGERGYDYTINYNPWDPNANDCRLCEKPPRWDYMENWQRRHLFYVYQALIDLKISEEVFETSNYNLDVNTGLKKIRLSSPDMSVVVLGNFNVEEGEIDPEFYSTGTWYDYFTGESLNVTDVNALISLAPGEYRLYTDKDLGTPDFVGINENISEGLVIDINIYPNPATSEISLDMYLKQQSDVQIDIYDLQGRMVKNIFSGQLSGGANNLNTRISDIKQGLYFIILKAEDQTITKKLMIR